MDYWQHSRLSAKKFGGTPADYLAIHRFIDSGKLFRHHVKHRLLLHNLYGAELAISLFGEVVENSEGQVVLVRDVVQAHCREDLGGRVPSLRDWLGGLESIDAPEPEAWPSFDDSELRAFMLQPYLRSGINAALWITHSDFGVHLVATCLDAGRALLVSRALAPLPSIGKLLDAFSFTARWQHSPRKGELRWLGQEPTSSGR